MYIVTSKPKRISVYSGLVHIFVISMKIINKIIKIRNCKNNCEILKYFRTDRVWFIIQHIAPEKSAINSSDFHENSSFLKILS